MFHIEMRLFRLAGYGAAGLFTAFAVAAARAGQYWPSIGFLLFALVGLYLVLGAGSFTINAERLLHRSLFGAWEIRWVEVTEAQCSDSGTLVLLGATKQFVLSPPSFWPKSIRGEAWAFVAEQLRLRHISPTHNRTADYRRMKNTRVSKSVV